jgi:hypothetical protein
VVEDPLVLEVLRLADDDAADFLGERRLVFEGLEGPDGGGAWTWERFGGRMSTSRGLATRNGSERTVATAPAADESILARRNRSRSVTRPR